MAKEWAKSFYKSNAWKTMREAILKRDKGRCVYCREKGIVRPAEEVHHIIWLTPENINDRGVSLNPSNLVSLCSICHKEQHNEQRIESMNKDKNKNGFKPDYVFNDQGELIPPGGIF